MLSTSDDSFSPTMFSAKQDILLLWSCEDKLDSRSTETWPDVKIWECESEIIRHEVQKFLRRCVYLK